MYKRTKLSMVLMFFVFNCAVQADWYKSVKFKMSDPYGINNMHSVGMKDAAILGEGIGDFKAPAITQGHIYRDLNKSKANEIESLGYNKYIHFTNILDSKEKDFWKKFFKEKTDLKVPFFINAIGVLNTYVGASALLIDTLLSETRIEKTSSSALAELMEVDGRFVNYLSIVRDSKNQPYLHTNVFYQTKVQGKTRGYLIYSRIIALNII